MSIETTNVILPARWASALINGDTSGLDDHEEKLLREAAASLAREGWYIVSVETDEASGEPCEPYFTWHYRMYAGGGDAIGGEVLEYVAHSITT